MDINIKPYTIASALEGILAQQLVRKICEHFKTAITPDQTILEMLKVSSETLRGKPYEYKYHACR
jgi:type II secretory ATPase GspE/PulE/Tfp pilus assembly ATPase PilB-like protein